MISDITIGQFFPGNSILHKMDPRFKILCSILFIVALFLCKSVYAFAMMTILTILLIAISSIPFKTIIKSFKGILIILIITSLINVFFTKGEHLLWEWKSIQIYEEGLWRALFTTIRIFLLIISTCLFLTYTTSPIDLTDAIESLLYPLKLLHVPVHDFAMMMTIALRFIPILLRETERIMSAQKARGADFESGSIFTRIKTIVPIIVPLLLSSFQSAMDLATAMECRCYRGGEGRTKLKVFKPKMRDFLMLLFHAGLIALIVFLNSEWLLGTIGWGFSL